MIIGITTNGILLDTDEKREAALLTDRVRFSIHGVDDTTMREYQRGAFFDRAYENMKRLVQYRARNGAVRPKIEWKYLLFNWNDRVEMIRRAVGLAREANVDTISFWPARTPLYGISWRYRMSGFFRHLGEPSRKGREVRIST